MKREGERRKCVDEESAEHISLECEVCEDLRVQLKEMVRERGLEWERSSFVESKRLYEAFNMMVRGFGCRRNSHNETQPNEPYRTSAIRGSGHGYVKRADTPFHYMRASSHKKWDVL
ncbi:hypothetical protein J6590_019156 [Homalodisca vitripennis]|nr:hypothetical protein J6590_019156 [Homalodisca vitripennis]